MINKGIKTQERVASFFFIGILGALAFVGVTDISRYGSKSYGLLGVIIGLLFLGVSIRLHRFIMPILLAGVILVPYIPLAGAGLSTDDLLPVMIGLIGGVYIFRKKIPYQPIIILFATWSVLSFLSVLFHTTSPMYLIQQI